MPETSPYIFGNFDVAEFCLIAFFLFFVGLVIYLRREDRREGYPLEGDASGRLEPLGGLLFTASPKTFVLPHGHGTRTVPNADRDSRVIAARRSAPMDGSPIEPTGDPLADGVGPGAYAERPNYADQTIEGHDRIVPARVCPEFYVAKQDADPRGYAVMGADGLRAGTLREIWLDRSELLVRYLEVSLDAGAGAGRTVLVPMTMAVIRNGKRQVEVRAITAAQFAGAPVLANPDQVTLYEEERIIGYFGGGYLYATADRQEPWL